MSNNGAIIQANRITEYAEPAPAKGQVVKYSSLFDRAMRYLTDDPTASKLKTLMRRVDDGDIAALCETQIELERKDALFAGVVGTRRSGITALDWTILPDPDHEDDRAAQEAADYIAARLKGVAMWPKVLEHLAGAIGPNVAAVEILWSKSELADFVLVPCTRFTTHPITNTGLAIKTDEEPLGYPVEAFINKFIVFQPYCKGGFPFRATLTHASIFPFLMGALSRIDWLAFSELFAMPLRVATYDETVNDADRVIVKNLLDQMSSDTAASLPKGVTVQFIQAMGTGETYQNQLHYVDKTIAVLWLGQTLTTDVVATGSYAAARVHNKVRSDLLASDLRSEAGCLREQLFRPMIELRFPGRDVPIPIFRRETSAIEDIDSKKLRLEQLAFAATQGLVVPRKWLYDALSIPRPAEGEGWLLKPGVAAPVDGETDEPDESADGTPEE